MPSSLVQAVKSLSEKKQTYKDDSHNFGWYFFPFSTGIALYLSVAIILVSSVKFSAIKGSDSSRVFDELSQMGGEKIGLHSF